MDALNSRFSERNAILATINPASQGVGTANSGWIPVALFHQIVALISIGAFGASATVDAKFQQATNGSGAGAKDITGKALTQLLAAGGNNRQAMIEIRPDDLDTNAGYTHVQFSITVGTAATLIQAFIVGSLPRFQTAADRNAASVAQIVA